MLAGADAKVAGIGLAATVQTGAERRLWPRPETVLLLGIVAPHRRIT